MEYDVLEARYVRDFIIWIRCRDGSSGEVDFTGELAGPVFEPLKDVEYFRQFTLDPLFHTLTWPNGADVAPEFLHRKVGGKVLTAQDFLRLPGFEDDGLRHELIDGEHVVTPSPAERHQRVSVDLTVALATYLKTAGTGRVYHGPLDIVLSDYDVVEPDLLVVLSDQLDIIGTKNVQGAPAIVIEILSPSGRHRDEVVKRDLYERAGVREYWIVDPEADSIAVWRRSAAGPFESTGALEAAAGGVLTTPLLPDFSLSLESLFAEP